jgi:radical SAM superfamily enzyme YgiQ (UPF0313 family)
MRILLVQPAPFENGRLGLENALWLSEPAALTALAAMVEQDHEVRILDMRLEEPDALPRVLDAFRPELVGITSMTTDAYQAQAVAHCAKAILGDGVFTLLGGHHPSLAPQEHDIPAIDAICIGEGEETIQELTEHLAHGGSPRELDAIAGLCFRRDGTQVFSAPRGQARQLDSFPRPARHLLGDYREQYFYGPALGMASIQTSRGCAFDCNFCAIWEFYDRRVRFLSAEGIVDRMEAVEERFIMFLDDNFLSHRQRIEELLDEIERRGVKKYWMIQGRTDFIAENPDLLRRMRDAGLMMVLSGYESNDEDALAAIQKDNTRANNLFAARHLNSLGIFTTGIFMTRPDFEVEDFDGLYAAINEMRVTIPLVVIHTPLPGTQTWRADEERLLTRDMRLFDLLHAVVPTRLPRRQFYEQYARWNEATLDSSKGSFSWSFLKRPRLLLALAKGSRLFSQRLAILRRTLQDPESYLRDEDEIIGEGAPPDRKDAVVPLETAAVVESAA